MLPCSNDAITYTEYLLLYEDVQLNVIHLISIHQFSLCILLSQIHDAQLIVVYYETEQAELPLKI